ncbi:MAG: acetylxylan esterase [candidate division KSB1 bacterium]|nr:acetylxylan esterase [candidate division KSB1 bacterium]
MVQHVKLICMILVLSAAAVPAGPNEVIRDEAKVPDYNLPDLLVLSSGDTVNRPELWFQKRRPEILNLFKTNVYGESPVLPDRVEFKVESVEQGLFGGIASRKQVTVYLLSNDKKLSVDLLMYIPEHVKGPVPAFLGLNFAGNQAVQHDPGIPLADCWVKNSATYQTENNRVTEGSRGVRSFRWPVEMIVARGYAVATVCYNDIVADDPELFAAAMDSFFPDYSGPDSPGAISIWAWGLRRILDYLELDPQIDPQRVAVIGHSRLGKTALWAGALDERFALVYSSCSGCGGAALSRRQFGETVKIINEKFPHWFCGRFKDYNDKVSDLPLDQHMLLSLIAPRPLVVASASKDLWADPRGEFLSAVHAGPVYRLLGEAGLQTETVPQPHQPVGSRIRYHIREGGHNITPLDWHFVLNFADECLK